MDTSTLKWSTVVENAAQSLTAPRYSLQDAPSHVEDVLGLYAVYGEIGVWHALGLGDPPDDRPLYVGKAEASLISRDLRTHFADGRTGSSTVRRSVAALLHDQLQLRGVPRNLRKPAYFHNYGLAPADDAKLTAWMNQYLELCVWAQGGDVELIEVERELLKKWRPPLNLQDVETPWKAMLSAKRKLMADEAREVAAGR